MPEIPIAVMSFPTRMVVGPGALSQLPDEVRTFGAARVLIVADQGLAKAGLVDRVESVLTDAKIGSARYLGISKNPVEADVLNGVDAYHLSGASMIVGLGGGASIDVAKAIRLKVTHPLPLADYDDLKGGDQKISADQPPMIAIPTTAGTGSEVGRSSVISIEGIKTVIFSPFMMPQVALLDAELTVSLPPKITAATGVDALTHAIEAYVGKGYHPFADNFALAAIARVGGHLRSAVYDGGDIRARHEMLLAASQGSIAFQKNLGACHALAHPLSAVFDLHHGLANALMLAHVIRFNREVAEERFVHVAQALGAKASVEGACRAVESIINDTGLPHRLRDVGVNKAGFTEMVRQAIVDPCAPGNPRELTSADARALYTAAF